MANKKELKVHFTGNSECEGARLACMSGGVTESSMIAMVTCKACKAFILKPFIDADWMQVDEQLILLIADLRRSIV